MTTLPVRRYWFSATAEQPLLLPAYAGSMLRGAFGHALRRLACMTRKPECQGCPLLATCPYPMIFETPPLPEHPLQKFSQMPNPYVIEPPLGGNRRREPGEGFDFAMVLMGDAISQLPLIIMAWERALQQGLGKARVRCRLEQVHQEGDDTPVYRTGQPSIRPHQPAPCDPFAPPDNSLDLHFCTPLRLQKQGKRVGRRELDARTLLLTLARRYQLLCDGHRPGLITQDFAQLSKLAETIRLEQDLHWHDWTRYSNRQQQEMQFGGLVGHIRLHGNLDAFTPLLHLGQWLHLGKNATFGLGQYHLLPTHDLKEAPQ